MKVPLLLLIPGETISIWEKVPKMLEELNVVAEFEVHVWVPFVVMQALYGILNVNGDWLVNITGDRTYWFEETTKGEPREKVTLSTKILTNPEFRPGMYQYSLPPSPLGKSFSVSR